MRQLSLPTLTHDLDALYVQRDTLERSLHALNTLKGYEDDWKSFSRFCTRVERSSLPASTETLSLYITDLLSQGRKVSTAVRRTSGVAYRHRASGYPSPATGATWSLLAGARRLLQQPTRQMQPLSVEQVREISGLLRAEGTPKSTRDRAIIVLGFTSALRRANITQLLLSDVTFTEKGVMLQIRQGKTDQEGRGRFLGIVSGKHPDTDLAECLKAWLAHRGTANIEGPLFSDVGECRHMAPKAVARIVKAGVVRIGLDPTKFSGHSMRAGMITEAGLAGVSHLVIAAHTGHTRMDTLRKYFRPADIWRANATEGLGL
jgi:site-specific recombinase XerD